MQRQTADALRHALGELLSLAVWLTQVRDETHESSKEHEEQFIIDKNRSESFHSEVNERSSKLRNVEDFLRPFIANKRMATARA